MRAQNCPGAGCTGKIKGEKMTMRNKWGKKSCQAVETGRYWKGKKGNIGGTKRGGGRLGERSSVRGTGDRGHPRIRDDGSQNRADKKKIEGKGERKRLSTKGEKG